MRNTLAMMVLVTAIGLSQALAADVTIKGMPPYTGAVINSVEGGCIHFHVAAGTILIRPIADVERVQIAGIEAFNNAEKALSAKEPDYAAAVQGYDGITDLESQVWLKRLVQYRKLKALDRSGQFYRAVQEWVNLLKDEKDAATPFVPAQVGKKGSPDNQKAIALLDGQRQAMAAGTPVYQAIAKVLMQVYRTEGMTDKAEELAGGTVRTTGRDDKKGAGGTTAAVKPAGTDADLQAKIQAAETLIREGQTPELISNSLRTLQEDLRKFGETDLPRVLLMMGKAQILLAQKAQGDAQKDLYIQGGLNCMRVFAHFPDAQESGEALLLAARANLGIGNRQAALAAYDHLISHYGNSPAAQQARQERPK